MTHYEWRMTCGACPEAYDLYLGDERVGYVRYRHGFLSAHETKTDYRNEIFTQQISREDDGILTQPQRNYFFPLIEYALYQWRERNRKLGAPWEG